MSNDLQLDCLIKKMAQDHRPELPSPDLIWWRAQILKKQVQKERIERPMMIMRMLAATVCLAVFLGLASKMWLNTVPLVMPLVIGAGVLSLASVAFLVRSPGTRPAKH
jgi:hypothetical protein